MLAIPGIIALVVFIYARPQEFYEPLRAVPLLYIFFGLAVFGYWLDLRVGNSRLRGVPQLPWVLAFFVWTVLTVLIRAPGEAIGLAIGLSVCVTLFLLIAHGVQTFRALHVVAAAVLAMVLFVCSVGAHQGFAETGCVIVDESIPGDKASGKPDGRPCETPRNCYEYGAEPGAEYQCERIGLFGTTSIGRGRVRYRGVLQDPNELALAGGVGLPLAFAFGQARAGISRRAVAIFAFLLVLLCAVLTASRGGQLVFLAVLAAYFISRVGPVGLMLGGVLALPLLMLGGRGGEDASSSTMQRVDCWAESLSMFRSHPFLGVGFGQFTEYHYMTAHNAYLLALAELGFPGMCLFSAILYLSGKIPVQVMRHVKRSGDPQVVAGLQLSRAWAMGLLAAFVGLAVGIFFLSFTFHYVLWIYLGLSGALYSAVRRHDTTFRVRMTWLDLAIVAAGNVGIIGLVYFYTRWKLG